MKNLERGARLAGWLRHSLCRRYAVALFSTFSELPENRTICWAFGCLVNGDTEILGAWVVKDVSEIPLAVFGDLRIRGIESVRYGLGDLKAVEADFLAFFRNAAVYPSIEQSLATVAEGVRPAHRKPLASLLRRMAVGRDVASEGLVSEISSEDLRQKYPGILAMWDEVVAGFQSLLELPEPYRRLTRSVDRTAMGLQERLTRAIDRRVPFTDPAEAFDFVADWLMRADLRLQRGRTELLLGGCGCGRWDRPLSGAVGASASAQGVLP